MLFGESAGLVHVHSMGLYSSQKESLFPMFLCCLFWCMCCESSSAYSASVSLTAKCQCFSTWQTRDCRTWWGLYAQYHLKSVEANDITVVYTHGSQLCFTRLSMENLHLCAPFVLQVFSSNLWLQENVLLSAYTVSCKHFTFVSVIFFLSGYGPYSFCHWLLQALLSQHAK